jgi:SAM-dependent methyltransferase
MDVITAVKEKYGAAARQAAAGQRAACGPSAGSGCGCDPITNDLYGADESGQVPDAALKASLGCGNPTALASLREGEVVLDLGSGGGIDVLLSARRVGPTGKAYGLDATDDMLALAETNKRESGLTNVEFLRGDIEQIPLPDGSVDVVISNCVINLAADKDRALREAFRVLRPGGRFAVSDIVVKGELPPALRQSMEAWVGCLAGALSETEYRDKLLAAGFENVDVEVTRVYDAEDARTFLADKGLDVDALVAQTQGNVVSAFVRASKPKICCGPSCCA